MENILEIKKAKKEDAVFIQEILQNAFVGYCKKSNISSAEALCESMEEVESDIQKKEVFIGYLDGVPVATVRLQLMDFGSAYLSRFGVLCEYQKMGIGKGMIEHLDKFAREKNIYSITLHTSTQNIDLVRFYFGRGFHMRDSSCDRGYVRALLEKRYFGVVERVV